MKEKLCGRHLLSPLWWPFSQALISSDDFNQKLFFFSWLTSHLKKSGTYCEHQQWLYSLVFFFYGWSAYPLIKSFFIRACQTIMFYLFRIPFVSDLKWNHIWGNSKRGAMVPAVAPSAYSLHPWKARVLQMEISIFHSTGSYANNHLSMKRALNYILMWNKNRDGPCAKGKKRRRNGTVEDLWLNKEAVWSLIDFCDNTDASEHSQADIFSKIVSKLTIWREIINNYP